MEIAELHNRWLSVEQLAIYLSISKETVYKLLDQDHIPAHKLGKLWRFQVEEIDLWLKSGQAASASTKVRGS